MREAVKGFAHGAVVLRHAAAAATATTGRNVQAGRAQNQRHKLVTLRDHGCLFVGLVLQPSWCVSGVVLVVMHRGRRWGRLRLLLLRLFVTRLRRLLLQVVLLLQRLHRPPEPLPPGFGHAVQLQLTHQLARRPPAG